MVDTEDHCGEGNVMSYYVSGSSLSYRDYLQVGAPLCDECRYLSEQQHVITYDDQRCDARWRHRKTVRIGREQSRQAAKRPTKNN